MIAFCGSVLLVAATYADSHSSETVAETRVMATAHSDHRLPYALVTDAGTSAARHSDSPQARLQYVQNYARGAADALIWGDEIDEDYQASRKTCEAAVDAQLKTIECGYSKGIEAIVSKRIAVTLDDFGYVRRTVAGRIRQDESTGLRYVMVEGEAPWLLAPSRQDESLVAGKCYELIGYLSHEGAFGTGSISYSREFIVVDASRAGTCPDKN